MKPLLYSVWKRLSPPRVLRSLRFWPPYWGAGIRVDSVDKDLTDIHVSMELTSRNTNYVGTHFGGSLYSMCDPWFMFMMMWNLGDEYVVWDQAAQINFLKPGTGTVKARFELPKAETDRVRQLAADGSRQNPVYTARILDEQGDVVAEVKKTLYVRKKRSRQ